MSPSGGSLAPKYNLLKPCSLLKHYSPSNTTAPLNTEPPPNHAETSNTAADSNTEVSSNTIASSSVTGGTHITDQLAVVTPHSDFVQPQKDVAIEQLSEIAQPLPRASPRQPFRAKTSKMKKTLFSNGNVVSNRMKKNETDTRVLRNRPNSATSKAPNKSFLSEPTISSMLELSMNVHDLTNDDDEEGEA
ncbi:unnamed protein product [Bemisia tabaci]|uniref:Uncharacterized protein n=1 Tax=Bemisia tabaci TaxID=7038 RepID=A0A9P0F0G8_BEMTA|nr:unnamed protein product [Bemisia tabaci]